MGVLRRSVPAVERLARGACALGAALLTLSACAAPSVKVTMLSPAACGEAATLRRVAVLPFEGTDGRGFTAEFEATLASISVGEGPYFQLVDRMDIERVLQEQGRGMDARFDTDNAAQLGKMLNADGVYAGHITQNDMSNEPYSEARAICLKSQPKYDKKGKVKEMECIQWGQKLVRCTKRKALFSYTPKLIEVETGRIVYNKNIDESSESKRCEDQAVSLKSEEELLREAKRVALGRVKQDIAPYYCTVEIRMMDDTDEIKDKAAADRFKQALEFAKNDRMDRACEMWNEVRSKSGDVLSVVYDLGICAETVGNLGEALNLYQRADRLLTKPDDRVNQALERVRKRMDDRKKLEMQTAQTNS